MEMNCESCKGSNVSIQTCAQTLDRTWGPLGYLMVLPKHQVFICQDCGARAGESYPNGLFGKLATILNHRLSQRRN